MSENHYAASVVIAAIAALLTFAAVAGCSSTASSHMTGGNVASSLATSSAVAKAKDQVNVCVQKTGATALLSSSGRTGFVNCMKALVPPGKQEEFKNCLTSAATSDRLWTSDGRAKFTNESLPNCVNAAA
jgi:curli biogenesis system outer membrane secretion channel CsgG